MGSPATPSYTKVRSTRAHEHIVDQLQQLILTGTLPPGARLPSEREMMLRFGVSRPTVREALRVTESMGLIDVRPGDPAGARVLGTPSLGISHLFSTLLKAGCTSVPELIELRMLIDSAAVTVASAGPPERLEPLAELLGQMRVATEPEAFAALDVEFHRALVAASGNRLFLLIFAALIEPIQALIESRLDTSFAEQQHVVLSQHEAILEALHQGDARQAAQAVRNHLGDFYLPSVGNQDKARIAGFLAALRCMA